FRRRRPLQVGNSHDDFIRQQIHRAAAIGADCGTAAGLAEERRAVAFLGMTTACQQRLQLAKAPPTLDEPQRSLQLRGTDPEFAGRAAAALLRGLQVVWMGHDESNRRAVRSRLDGAIHDGLLTPLEADTL